MVGLSRNFNPLMDRVVGGNCRLTALAASCPGVPTLDVTLLSVDSGRRLEPGTLNSQ